MMRFSPAARLVTLVLLASSVRAGVAHGQLRPQIATPGILRVCADPDNMPLSNQKGEGFEQKIAELIGREWHSKVEYAWWPVRRGYFARALNGRYCDVAMQAPGGLDMAGVTKAYYRSGYFFVTRRDGQLADLTSLADPRLKKARIGVNLLNSDAENPPPVMALSRYGVIGNLTGYSTFFSDQVRPEDIIKGVANKDVDIAIVWGPVAGYFAAKSPVPLKLTPLAERDSLSDLPFRFDIGLAVRRRDRELRDSLQNLMDRKRPEIEAILKEYGVPMFPIQQAPADKPAGATNAPADTTKKAGPG
ncbi:MAG TPA: quinoprotein dehydrogenase-associated putative ABC transporter substrate-binding protein [Gemmatimonadales bacterium]|nr:quinoprotein dehydrogenase-associated putative ABC transporter substrate-binding protein [Gemmatimonadales bacterium]